MQSTEVELVAFPEERLCGVLAEVVRSLPILQMTPENAVRRSKFTKSTGRYLRHRGGWEISGMKAVIACSLSCGQPASLGLNSDLKYWILFVSSNDSQASCRKVKH
jgi:hypothetical protein